MSDWEGPRRARPEEFGEAMRFTDLVFRPGQAGRRILQRQYPHAYRDEPAYARRLLLLRHRGDLVGCLGIHPMTLHLGAARVKAGGIGIVGAHPERRGEGIMTRLLDDALARMDGAGYAVSVLGGDRQRYGRWGWENGGVRTVLHLTARSLGAVSGAERRLRLVRITNPPGAALCRRILRLGSARPFWMRRSVADMGPLLVRNGRDTWTCEDGSRFAYAVVSGEQRRNRPYVSVDEFGGDPALVLSILRRLLTRSAAGRLAAIAGPNPDQLDLLLPVSASWSRLCDGMVNILDLGRLVKQLRPELVRRAAAHKITGTFDLQSPDAGKAALSFGGRRTRAHRIRLSRREYVELLFGCVPVAESFGGRVGNGVSAVALASLSRILPLPLHVPPLNHI